jgi:Phage shock protein A (IM30), suppresses sigma54-dependent transcription
MSKQSIFGRIAQLAKANINALIDSAEDPSLMLDQMVRDYTNSIAEAESAIAQTIGNLRLLEQDHAEDIANADDWGRKALAASRKGDELRSGGNTVDADKFDALAKVALGRQLSAEKEARTAEPTIATQTAVVEQLKNGLNAMRGKLSQLSAKRDELNARAKTVQAQSQVQDAIKSIDLLDPTSEVNRFEQKIRREEARVRGSQELAASSLDAQFEQLESSDEQVELDARLAALKAGAPAQRSVTSGQ